MALNRDDIVVMYYFESEGKMLRAYELTRNEFSGYVEKRFAIAGGLVYRYFLVFKRRDWELVEEIMGKNGIWYDKLEVTHPYWYALDQCVPHLEGIVQTWQETWLTKEPKSSGVETIKKQSPFSSAGSGHRLPKHHS